MKKISLNPLAFILILSILFLLDWRKTIRILIGILMFCVVAVVFILGSKIKGAPFK